MTPQTYVGPYEQVFPHLQALDGAEGTLVLRPGEDYDFSGQPAGYAQPPGPAWWWKPVEATAPAAPIRISSALPAPAPAAAGAAQNQEG